ncbi:phage tail protein, partial [Achromobacter xylosoxidans]
RALGSRQAAQVRVRDSATRIMGPDFDTASYMTPAGTNQGYSRVSSLLPDAGTAETRPRNVAYHPRIHA